MLIVGDQFLWQAVKNNDVEKFEMSLSRDDSIDLRTLDLPVNVLHFAVKCGSPDIVQSLIDKGLRLNQTDTLGITPLLYAIEEISDPAIRLDVVGKLLRAEANPNKGDESINKFAPLLAACTIGDASVVKLLIRFKADLNVADTRLGWTALHWAAYGGSPAVLQLLLEAGLTSSQVHINNQTNNRYVV